MAIDTPTKQLAAALRAFVGFQIDRRHHVVDMLIEGCAGRFLDSPLLWRTLRQLLNPLLKHEDAIRIADRAGLSGQADCHQPAEALGRAPPGSSCHR